VWGNLLQLRFCRLCGQRPRAQRSLSADLAFCYFFAKKKVIGNLLCSPEIINVDISFLIALISTRRSIVFNRRFSTHGLLLHQRQRQPLLRSLHAPRRQTSFGQKGGKTMVAGAVAEHSNNLQKRRP